MFRLLLILIASTLLFGCTHRERIVLLPGPDGKVGTVTVHGPSGDTTLNTAYAAAEVARQNVETKKLSEAEVRQKYRSALEAVPKRPAIFTLQFAFKTQFFVDSKGMLDAIMSEYTSRAAPEVTVIGHTDQVGESQYNEELSRRRAETARDILVKEGIPKEAIEVVWRGDRDPIPGIKGMDARNRRVEVRIR